jgi:CRP-like cAMP-binding protein
MSERFVKDLFPNNMTLDYPRRAVIFFQGSPADVIYWLGKGIVDLYRPTNDGNLPLTENGRSRRDHWILRFF